MQFICCTKCLPNDGSFSGCSLCHAFSCQVMSDTTLVSSKHLSVSSSLLLLYVYFPPETKVVVDDDVMCIHCSSFFCWFCSNIHAFCLCYKNHYRTVKHLSLSRQPLTKIEIIQFRLNISQGIYFPSFSTRSLSFSLHLNDSLTRNGEVKKKKRERERNDVYSCKQMSRESEKCLLDDDVTEHVFLSPFISVCLSPSIFCSVDTDFSSRMN